MHPPPSANGTGVMFAPLLLPLLLAEFPAGVAVAEDDAEDGDPKDDPKKDEKLNCPGLLVLLFTPCVSHSVFLCGLSILSSDPFL